MKRKFNYNISNTLIIYILMTLLATMLNAKAVDTNSNLRLTAPVINNTSVMQRTDGSKIVDIYYDLSDAENDLCTITVQLSTNNGTNFSEFPNPANLSGDLGDNISVGTSKHIVWNAGADDTIYNANQFVIKISSEDNTESFILVQGGTFTMGNTLGGGDSNELPLQEVTLNSFLMGKYEVTQSEWQTIMGSNPASGSGVGDNYPVYSISWYAILKYCNLRSIAEFLTPVYTISGSTNTNSWGSVPTSENATWNAAICNWNANGYRLPTEAEWEYAARGGTSTPDFLYSGSSDIGVVAWYNGNNSPTGCKQVGTKAANGQGFYDMSGNVFEWCWDWYGLYSPGEHVNPTGPTTGTYRLLRGGGWTVSATHCRVSFRNYYPTYIRGNGGFRLCRTIN